MEWLLAALIGGFLGFNALATPGRAEKTLETSLRKVYPQATINAAIQGKKGRAVLKGNFKRVRLEMDNIGALDKLPFATGTAKKVGFLGRLELSLKHFQFGGLPVDNSEFNFNNVSYDFNALRKESKLLIVQCGSADAKIVLNAAALQQSFGDALDDVTDVKIALREGLLQMDAKKTLPLIKIGVPFHLTATPIVKNGNEIWLTDGHLSFENTTELSLRVNNLLADLNPIYTFDAEKKWPFLINLSRVSSQNNQMTVFADLIFAGSPQITAPQITAPQVSLARETPDFRTVWPLHPTSR